MVYFDVPKLDGYGKDGAGLADERHYEEKRTLDFVSFVSDN